MVYGIWLWVLVEGEVHGRGCRCRPCRPAPVRFGFRLSVLVSGFGFRVSLLVSGFGFRVSGFVFSFGFGFGYMDPGFGSRVECFQVSVSGCIDSGEGCTRRRRWFSVFGFRVYGFGFRGSGIGFWLYPASQVDSAGSSNCRAYTGA